MKAMMAEASPACSSPRVARASVAGPVTCALSGWALMMACRISLVAARGLQLGAQRRSSRASSAATRSSAVCSGSCPVRATRATSFPMALTKKSAALWRECNRTPTGSSWYLTLPAPPALQARRGAPQARTLFAQSQKCDL